jgi:hypothetical protein
MRFAIFNCSIFVLKTIILWKNPKSKNPEFLGIEIEGDFPSIKTRFPGF